MLCHICKAAPVGQCQACWKFYCAEHGDMICSACKDGSDVADQERVIAEQHNQHPEDEQPPRTSLIAPDIRLRTLRRVLPICQSQTRGSTKLTAASLEVYDDGSRLIFSIQRPRAEEPRTMLERSIMYGFPRTVWEAVDDRDQIYSGVRSGGGGGGADWRFEVILLPAIPDDARHVSLTCVQIHWEAHGLGTRSRVQPGPWRFEIDLA